MHLTRYGCPGPEVSPSSEQVPEGIIEIESVEPKARTGSQLTQEIDVAIGRRVTSSHLFVRTSGHTNPDALTPLLLTAR
ncbi:MAG: hypothetical protein GXP35_16545 [Actinobacteria bacterium]|nr:hypothetical protein [Actinomycetota bacterium]